MESTQPRISTEFLKFEKYVFRNDSAFPLRAVLQDPQTQSRAHQHEFAECAIVVRGTGEHQSNSNPYCPIATGDVIVIPIGGFHNYRNTNDLAVVNLLFDTGKLPPVLMELYSHPVYKRIFLRSAASYGKEDFPLFHLDEQNYAMIKFYLDHLVKLCLESGNHCIKLGLFMVLINLICTAGKQLEGTTEAVPLNIPKLISFLGANYHRKVYTAELCHLSGMAPATLLRHFQAALGTTPAAYLRKIRLRHAAEMLLNTDFSLQDVAVRCGFATDAYFFRMFKKEYGIPPLQYRRKSSR